MDIVMISLSIHYIIYYTVSYYIMNDANILHNIQYRIVLYILFKLSPARVIIVTPYKTERREIPIREGYRQNGE